MSDLAALRHCRDQPKFSHWAPDVADDRIAAATDSINQLIDDVVSLGPDPAEDDIRSAVSACVRRFNDLDELDPNSWIFTIEREDIAEIIWKVIDLAGFEGDEDWLEDREW
jgi:hypothetical protein